MSQKTINITGVSLCKKAGRIRIFHSTIKRLGEPKYIRFLFNPEKQLFAVQASDRKDSECFYVPKCSENSFMVFGVMDMYAENRLIKLQKIKVGIFF